MANKPLITLVNELINKQTRSLTPVRNLRGTPGIAVANPIGKVLPQHWTVFNLPGLINPLVPLSPDDVLHHLATVQIVSAPSYEGKDGLLLYSAPAGTSLAATVV